MNKPNWDKWSLMPEVELWEAAALSLDIDPDEVGTGSDSDGNVYMDIKDAFNGMSKSFIDRLEIIERSAGITLNPVSKSPWMTWKSKVPLSEFVSWCVKNKLQMPNELADKHDGNKTPPPDFDKASPTYPPVDNTSQDVKWRKAFEYESEGLNALYDLIEHHFFDENDNPIYDSVKWPLKKNLESDWLTGRTLDEADTIITSSKRKGKAEK